MNNETYLQAYRLHNPDVKVTSIEYNEFKDRYEWNFGGIRVASNDTYLIRLASIPGMLFEAHNKCASSGLLDVSMITMNSNKCHNLLIINFQIFIIPIKVD